MQCDAGQCQLHYMSFTHPARAEHTSIHAQCAYLWIEAFTVGVVPVTYLTGCVTIAVPLHSGQVCSLSQH